MQTFFNEDSMYKVLQIFEYCTLNNLIFNEQTIAQIVNILLFDNKLESIRDDIKICFNQYLSSKAGFDEDNKVLIFNTSQLCNVNNILFSKRNNSDIVYSINKSILIVIFHELCHVISFYNLFNYPLVVKNIFDYTKSIMLKNRQLYKKEAVYLPWEREATIFAFEHLIWLMNKCDRRIVNYNNLKSVYYDFFILLIDGYGPNYWNNNPLQVVLKSCMCDSYDLIANDIINENMELYDRLRFGFPISDMEKSYLRQVFDDVCYGGRVENIDVKQLLLRR